MKKIIINGIEHKITMTISVYYEICSLCGSIENLSDWLKEKDSHNRLRTVINIFLKGHEQKEKYRIKKGLDKEKEFPDYELPKFFKSHEIISAYTAIFAEATSAMYHEIPQSVDINKGEADFTYERVLEIQAEEKGMERPNKALVYIARGLSCGIDYETLMNAMTPGEVMQIWLYQIEARGGTKNGR